MNLGKFAIKATQWISAALGWYRTNRMTLDDLVGSNKRLRRVLKAADKLERAEGAKTNLFSRVEAAHKSGTELTLTAAEVTYLYAFKAKVWDRLWEPFKEAAAGLPDDEPAPVPGSEDDA